MGLVLFQFCVSTFLILAFQIISLQTAFIQNKDLGYEKDLILNIPTRDPKTLQKTDLIKNTLKSSGIVSISFSANLLGGGDWGIPLQPEGIPANQVPPIRILVVDYDFVTTYGLTLVDGRNFSGPERADSLQGYLINEAAAKALGWNNPVGKKISMPAIGRGEGEVVGVLKDFNFRSLHETVQPIVLLVKADWFNVVSVKIGSKNVPETIDFLAARWKEWEPEYPFTYTFFDQTLSGLYAAEQRTQHIVKYSSVVAVLVACIGLFSMASFHVDKHAKEFGIRKVMGASVFQIVVMQLRQYTVLAIAGSSFSCGIAFVIMNNWLDHFAYKTSIGPLPFVIGILATLLITWATVSVQCIKAGTTNPVHVLKGE
jgi:putative ABC transport system permease protein